MAKVRFYCDLWPGIWPKYPLHATTSPHERMKGAKRLAFDVTIPDNILLQLDMVSPEPATVTIIELPEGEE